MTTMYHLDLKQGEGGSGTTRILAGLVTEDAATMAATLRAVADRLDPPKPPRPAYRTPVPLRDAPGLPNYAHDADCNTVHDAGPEPCPPPRPRCPAIHANGRACIRTAHGDIGHKLAWATSGEDMRWNTDGLPVPAPLHPAVADNQETARRRRRPGRTVETDLDRAARLDGCGREHTYTGACAYTVVERINPNV